MCKNRKFQFNISNVWILNIEETEESEFYFYTETVSGKSLLKCDEVFSKNVIL